MPTILTINGKTPVIHPSAFIASNATIAGQVYIGERANVWYGAVLRADQGFDIRIGRNSSIQDNSVIHTSHINPTIVKNSVTVGHGAVLEGCVIEDGALIGMNACVLDGSSVGAGSLIAAGSVVREGDDIPAKMLAAGVPAKVKKELNGSALEHVSTAADVFYQKLMDLHKDVEND